LVSIALDEPEYNNEASDLFCYQIVESDACLCYYQEKHTELTSKGHDLQLNSENISLTDISGKENDYDYNVEVSTSSKQCIYHVPVEGSVHPKEKCNSCRQIFWHRTRFYVGDKLKFIFIKEFPQLELTGKMNKKKNLTAEDEFIWLDGDEEEKIKYELFAVTLYHGEYKNGHFTSITRQHSNSSTSDLEISWYRSYCLLSSSGKLDSQCSIIKEESYACFCENLDKLRTSRRPIPTLLYYRRYNIHT